MPRITLPRLAIPAAGFMLAILAVHAALLPEAHWQGDDFLCSAFARDYGLAYLWHARIAGWSPRPLSETIFFLYGRLAASLQRPLAVPFLALLWILLFASTLVTMRRRRWNRVLLGLATCCLFLLGHPVGEMFYWPAGAVAYLTTLTASSLVVFLLIDGRSQSWGGLVALSASLAACAACSEAGACLAVLPAAGLAVLNLRRPARALTVGIPGLAVAGFVFWTVAGHRLASAEATGHLTLLRSLRPVLPELWREASSTWVAKLAFLLGARWSLAGTRKDGRSLAVCVLALLLAPACVIAAAWHQFGSLCCERHESLRQCWAVLLLLLLGAASLQLSPVARRNSRLAPVALLLACLLEMAPRLQPILHDLRQMAVVTAIQNGNWRDARSTSDTILFRLPPPAEVTGASGLPPGHFSEPATAEWAAHGVMQFFRKQHIVILPSGANP